MDVSPIQRHGVIYRLAVKQTILSAGFPIQQTKTEKFGLFRRSSFNQIY
jgi:hypothetical protein